MSTRRMTGVAVAMILTACSRSEAPAAHSVSVATGDIAIETAPAGAIHFSVAATGNAARYRVREQLMGKDLSNDAIGETNAITGGITVDSTTGSIIAAQSKFTVATGGLKSDSDRRDGYVRGRLLETEKFPTVELSPLTVKGLTAAAMKGATPVSFDLIGELTVKGVKHATTWRITARQVAGTVTGSAVTKFTFADFGINPPKVPIVLSVADTIALEYDFTLTRDGAIR